MQKETSAFAIAMHQNDEKYSRLVSLSTSLYPKLYVSSCESSKYSSLDVWLPLRNKRGKNCFLFPVWKVYGAEKWRTLIPLREFSSSERMWCTFIILIKRTIVWSALELSIYLRVNFLLSMLSVLFSCSYCSVYNFLLTLFSILCVPPP